MRRAHVLWTTALLGIAAGSIAQSVNGQTTGGTTSPPELGAGNGPSDAAVATKRNYGEISGGTANSKVSLSVATDISPPESGWLPAFAVLSLAASTPLGTTSNSTSSNTTQLANLDGLADSTNLTLKGIGFWVKTRNPNKSDLNAFCADLRTAAETDKAKKASKQDLKRCHSAKGIVRTCGAGTVTCCSNDNAELLSCLGVLDRDDVNKFERGSWASPVTWAAGTSVTVGSKNYQFLSRSTSANTKETLTPWSAQIFVAEQSGNSLFTGGFRYQIAYKDATTGSLCPAPKTYPVQCKTGPIGPPPRTESPIPYLEFRHEFSPGFAIDPSVNYDLKQSVVGITLPVYFVGNGNGKLTGGASVGWRSDQGGPQFALFVGTAFSLSPQ